MKYKQFGITMMSFVAMMLLITSTNAAVPSYNTSIHKTTFDSANSLEFLFVTAGRDDSVLASVYSLGNADASTYPDATTSTKLPDADGLSNAYQWAVIFADQAGFETHLNRIPRESPDGLSFYVYYDSHVVTDTFTAAFNARAAIEAVYGVTMVPLVIDTSDVFHFYSFVAISSTDAEHSAVKDDLVAINNDGFASLFSTSQYDTSPARWVGYGVSSVDLDGDYGTSSDRIRLSAQGMGLVIDGGITTTGSVGAFEYTISSNALFGDFSPLGNVGSDNGLSRILYYIPYPVEPTDISPSTTNLLPHVTGTMQWDLRFPYGDPVSDVADYSVTFELGMDNSFPMVQNELSVDGALLDAGTLQMKFNVENVGGATAKDVKLKFPLGPDFGELVNRNITYYSMRDGFSIDTSFDATYSLKLDATGAQAAALKTALQVAGWDFYDYEAFVLDGWFDESGSPALWNDSVQQVVLYSNTVSATTQFGTVQGDVTLTVDSNGAGFPQPFLDGLDVIKQVIDLYNPDISLYSNVENLLNSDLPGTLVDTFNSSFFHIFQELQGFIVNQGDFNLVTEETAISLDETRTEWFMEATIPTLLPGAENAVELVFSIDNIPSKTDTLPFMQLETGEDVASGLPTATVISDNANYNDVLKYAFYLFGFDGRPLSIKLPTDFILESFNADGDTTGSNTYGSKGMEFTWKNDKGFSFFGLSNGLNLQLADDEATISATAILDEQEYRPGDMKTITVDIKNNGIIPADNVVVHVFQSRLGRDFDSIFYNSQKVGEKSLGSLAAGESASETFTVEANSFLGYSPVFAVVEFDTELGITTDPVPDFLNDDDTSSTVNFAAGSESHQFVMSTLSGALLLPESALTEPAIPEPRVEVDASVTDQTITYTMTNVGTDDTVVTLVQSYDKNLLTVTDADVTAPSEADVVVANAAGLVAVDGITLAPGESKVVTITFAVTGTETVTIPPAVVEFTVDGESSLGATVDMGSGASIGGGSSLGLLAGAAAQQQSQQSATQDSSSSAYSSSTSVGASANTKSNEDKQTASGGFLGVSFGETLGLMLLPITLFSIRRRKN
jgi:hypothetical protein